MKFKKPTLFEFIEMASDYKLLPFQREYLKAIGSGEKVLFNWSRPPGRRYTEKLFNEYKRITQGKTAES